MSDPVRQPEIRELLDAAEAFAHEAGEITLRWFGSLVDAEAKADGSPVTQADRAAETHIRERVRERFPSHGVLGEEFPETNPDARVRWILDPIDGTRSFMRGIPLYGVLIGVEVEGEPVVGVVHFPALDETVAAGRGEGCRWNGDPCRVSGVTELAQALVLTTDAERVGRVIPGSGWRKMAEEASFARTWGDCYGHVLVATGRAEVMVDPEFSLWDAAPFLTIITEAGGRFTSRDGEATIHGGSGISTNGALHDEVLERLRSG
jgi:histidinol-phosphatase